MNRILLIALPLALAVALSYCQAFSGNIKDGTVKTAQVSSQSRLPDYKALARGCQNKLSEGCCLASVSAMEAGQYFLDTGETFRESTCPQGYEPDMLKCESSYRWCVPVVPKRRS